MSNDFKPKINRHFIYEAILYLFAIPAFLAVAFSFYGIIGIINPQTNLLALFVLLIILIAYVREIFLREMGYPEPTVNKITMNGINEEIEEILKTTTNRGGPINRVLLLALRNKHHCSQTELVEAVEKAGIDLSESWRVSQPWVKHCMDELETKGLINNPKTVYQKKYSLTKKGIWCCKLIHIFFPKTKFWFLVRNGLGYYRVEQVPEN